MSQLTRYLVFSIPITVSFCAGIVLTSDMVVAILMALIFPGIFAAWVILFSRR